MEKTNSIKKRDNGLDLLRIIAAVLVVAVHVYTIPYKTAAEAYKQTGVFTAAYCWYNVQRCFAEVAVPVYILISGGFSFSGKKDIGVKQYYRNVWKKFGIPTLVFTGIYLIERTCFYYGLYAAQIEKPLPAVVSMQLKALLKGYPAEHMWYMYMLLGVSLIMPFAVRIKNGLSDEEFRTMAWIVWIWGTLSNLVGAPEYFWSLGFCMNMLGIFMLGSVARGWGLKKRGSGSAWKIILAGIMFSLIQVGLQMFAHEIGKALGGNAPYAPLTVLAGFCYVAGFTALEMKKGFGILPAATFWVYLIHPLIITLVSLAESKIMKCSMYEIGKTDFAVIPNVSLAAVLILSFAAACIIEKLRSRRRSQG